MNCSRNDIVLLPIPFSDLTSKKIRPAVVIGTTGLDIFLVPISSKLHNTEFTLQDWKASGLNIVCGVKAQLATVECKLIRKVVGTLSRTDAATLDQHLYAWLHLPPQNHTLP